MVICAQKYSIATKTGLEWKDGRYFVMPAGANPAGMEESLRRLRNDHIDIYQVHWPDPLVRSKKPRGDAYIFKQGKIRAIGVSNFSVDKWNSFTPRCAPACTAAAL